MSKFKIIVALFAVVVFFGFACNALFEVLSGKKEKNDLDKIHKLEIMTKDTVHIAAVQYDSVFHESRKKGKSIDYIYVVDGKEYKNSMKFNNEDELLKKIFVHYSDKDPTFISFDPETDLKEAKESKESKTQLWVSIAGIVLLPILFLLFLGRLKTAA
ncbi:MAG: hypothetical protein RLZZ175_2900 [Bacteroidota bacterium]|jgi:outer membrane phospholipase A